MSDNSPFGFGRFVPGFDFLQNLTKGATSGMPAMPSLSGWVAPTLSVEDLDKRIAELKTVQFWLEQNARALTATVQALEVQRMTLSTLKGMNVAMGDMAQAFGKGVDAFTAAGSAPAPSPAATFTAPPPPVPEPPKAATEASAATDAAAPSGDTAPGLSDPLLWWSALTTQFQEIATKAMQDMAPQKATFDATLDATREMAEEAIKTATSMAQPFVASATQAAAQAAASAKATAKPASSKAASPSTGKATAKAGAKTSAKPAAKASSKTGSSTTAASRKRSGSA